jgi:hypothetical protein
MTIQARSPGSLEVCAGFLAASEVSIGVMPGNEAPRRAESMRTSGRLLVPVS